MLNYRKIEHKDIRAVIDLEIDCMRALRDGGDEIPAFDERTNNEANLVAIVEAGCGHALLAENVDDRGTASLAGAVFALDSENRAPEEQEFGKLIVLNVFVDPGFREMGIGTTLLSMVEDWAKGNGYRKIVSGIYLPNEFAAKLFKGKQYRAYYEAIEKDLGE